MLKLIVLFFFQYFTSDKKESETIPSITKSDLSKYEIKKIPTTNIKLSDFLSENGLKTEDGSSYLYPEWLTNKEEQKNTDKKESTDLTSYTTEPIIKGEKYSTIPVNNSNYFNSFSNCSNLPRNSRDLEVLQAMERLAESLRLLQLIDFIGSVGSEIFFPKKNENTKFFSKKYTNKKKKDSSDKKSSKLHSKLYVEDDESFKLSETSKNTSNESPFVAENSIILEETRANPINQNYILIMSNRSYNTNIGLRVRYFESSLSEESDEESE